MKTYSPLTLSGLIGQLNTLPAGSLVTGFHPVIHSYRGYYERNALPVADAAVDAYDAADVAARLTSQIGKPITGWKGGDYQVSSGELVYLSNERDTGPVIAGLEVNEDGIYEPVLIEYGWEFLA